MKDLNTDEIYDLRGITEEQARKLHDWLVDNDIGWVTNYYNFYSSIQEYISIKYTDMSSWILSDSKPTTHISTLFEKPYEQQLQEPKKKLEHYKKEVERLENESKPKVGNVCKFWNTAESDFFIGILTSRYDGAIPYEGSRSSLFRNAKKVTEQEVINLLFKKS